jgi:hypothetical protein
MSERLVPHIGQSECKNSKRCQCRSIIGRVDAMERNATFLHESPTSEFLDR